MAANNNTIIFQSHDVLLICYLNLDFKYTLVIIQTVLQTSEIVKT